VHQTASDIRLGLGLGHHHHYALGLVHFRIQLDIMHHGVCYISQAAPENELKELFKAIECASHSNILIIGDFNYPKRNWDAIDCDSDSSDFSD